MAAPRARAADLQGRYDSAVAAGRHQDAADLQPELAGAHEQLVLAEAKVGWLRQTQETMNRQEAERQAAEHQARRREQAEVVIAQALDAERLAREEITAKLDLMWSCVAAAKTAFLDAQALEGEAAPGAAPGVAGPRRQRRARVDARAPDRAQYRLGPGRP